MPLRVLISGAGIAGPALAFWLGRLGHTCTIIERFPSLRANGQQVDLRKQGIEAARRMGILESIRAHIIDELGLQVVDSTGRQRALFARIEDDAAGRQGFTSEFELCCWNRQGRGERPAGFYRRGRRSRLRQSKLCGR
ncbi:hypothetical protein JDV02_001412 [Purpureocillium takamizusanense]|uniref:FAD-binding domain-containing protein n=1 Tax=Purpureocillium takamizusanense TaxID=2060973 RepID=A0A9Q8Q841_9HYPO|nr:uncharacterized protein JDV02_001412 [Purpureocillium takamizusanense]UNI14820.1 hypothetical protein JDV02_001412 [Purpureocillium takamizusanense]